jgi:hypothetical protein
MDKSKYAETVIAEAYKRSMAGTLKWRVERNYILAALAAKIEVTIHYFDQGPDSAHWEYATVNSPVNRELTMLGNPQVPKAKYCDIQAKGEVLNQLNQIFRQMLLDPRTRGFESAIKKLGEG